jgi:hypothetical protein
MPVAALLKALFYKGLTPISPGIDGALCVGTLTRPKRSKSSFLQTFTTLATGLVGPLESPVNKGFPRSSAIGDHLPRSL